MSGDLEATCTSAALRALRAGATDARDSDGLGMDAVGVVLGEVIQEYGSDGVFGLVAALSLIGGALIADLAEAARLHIEAYMDGAILAEITRQTNREASQ